MPLSRCLKKKTPPHKIETQELATNWIVARGVLGDMSYTIQTGLRRESGVKALLGELIELQKMAALSIANLQEEGKWMRIFAHKETLKF
eukprot:3889268-Amphidinium_carterae.1